MDVAPSAAAPVPVPAIPPLPADYTAPLAATRTKIISMYNFKGGVAKTTSTYMTGWALASKGFKVIMFDFDAQRNLSQAVLRARIRKHGDNYGRYFARLPQPRTVAEALQPAVTMAQPLRPMYTDLVATFPDLNGELRLALGDQGVSVYESKIPLAEGIFVEQPSLANIPGAPLHMALMTAAAYGANVCLFDLSPSMGALNRTLLCSSDYFMVPCSGDYFTMEATMSVANFMVGPTNDHYLARATGIMQRQMTMQLVYPIRAPRPMFLGTLMTRFSVRAKEGADGDVVLAKAVQTAIDAVDTAVREVLVKALRGITPANRGEGPFNAQSGQANTNVDLAYADAVYSAAGVDPANYRLIMLRDFMSLNPISQYLAVPAPFVTPEMGMALNTWCESAEHKAALVEAVERNIPVDIESTDSYPWHKSFADKAAELKGTVHEYTNRLLELLGQPMAIRMRPFSRAVLAPLFQGANAVDPRLVFVGF